MPFSPEIISVEAQGTDENAHYPRWVSLGGTVDTVNNTVTASITALHLYAITFDTTPPDIGQLTPTPSSTVNQSDPLIQAYVEDDTGALDAASVALLLDGAEVFFAFDDGYVTHTPINLSKGEYTITISASDLFGNASEQTWSFMVSQMEVNIQMESNWNLISIPVELADTSREVVLQSIDGLYNSVWAYDPVNGWERYVG